ncbi:MAG: class I SAM-dependent methyltransferase [Actinobacteria bacterium]|nr:class I SAM-dependent methyltransferase [Actinomycetota bacterium]
MDDAEALVSRAAEVGVALKRRQADRLIEFEHLLIERAIPDGLVAHSDAPRIRDRHLLDCLRAAPIPAPGERCYDLGSGAGLPGVVVALTRPDLRVTLVERRAHRVAFLELALEVLGPENAVVLPTALEDIEEPVDLCFARALEPLRRAWASARRLLLPDGRLVYFAGREPDAAEIPPDAVLQDVLTTPVLESAGPLVIMARQ